MLRTVLLSLLLATTAMPAHAFYIDAACEVSASRVTCSAFNQYRRNLRCRLIARVTYASGIEREFDQNMLILPGAMGTRSWDVPDPRDPAVDVDARAECLLVAD